MSANKPFRPSNRLMKKLNAIVALVRKRGELTIADACQEFHIAPPTAYQYFRLCRDLFEDLDYDWGKLYVRGKD